MAAQTVTNRMSVAELQRLAVLHEEIESDGASPPDLLADSYTTATITITYTKATGAITLNFATT